MSPLPLLRRRNCHDLLPAAGTTAVLLLCLTGCSVGGSALGATATTKPTQATTSNSAHSTTVSSAGITTQGSSSVPIPSVDQLAIGATSKVGPAVVKVTNVGKGLGSGVVMTKSGYIVTNHHVVSGASKITVTLANGTTKPARLIGADPVDDLAVVKIAASNLPVATFGDSSQLKVGQTVLAIGNPLGITRTVTEGIVSALDRTVEEGQGGGSIPRAIQTSAPINPGNSGGALIDLGAQVVGIPTLTAIDPEFNAPASGIGFAIPSNRVVSIAGQIIKYGRVVHSGRAALGIYAVSVTPGLAAQYGLPVNHGVLVARFSSGSDAKKAGLRAGDIIVQAGGKAVQSQSDLLDILGNKSPGQSITVTVVTQQGGRHMYTVKLTELNVNSTG